MEQIPIPEISFTPDSEGDYGDEFWHTSRTASFDTSSVNSIPWAEDVIKQNQEQWERIERMFYGEEDLPTDDDKLRNEVQEWCERFPHLRVIGTSKAIHFNGKAVLSDPNYEEIIAIHPPLMLNRKSACIMSSTRGNIERFHSQIDEGAIRTKTILEDDIEKCLRITSGPLLARRLTGKSTHNMRTYQNLQPHGVCTEVPIERPNGRTQQFAKPNLVKSSTIQSVRSNYDNVRHQITGHLYEPVVMERLHQIPYSARIIKIPAVKSDAVGSNLIRVNNPNVIRIKTASLVPINRPMRNSITLPSINIVSMYLDSSKSKTSNGRSTSAFIGRNLNKKMHSTALCAIKKRSDSE